MTDLQEPASAPNDASGAYPVSARVPTQAGKKERWHGVTGSALAITLGNALPDDRCVLVVTEDTRSAEQIQQEIRFFANVERPVIMFPDWETLVYDSFSPHQDIISNRLAFLNQIAAQQGLVLVVPIGTLMQRMAPREFIRGSSLVLDVGQRIDVTQMRRKLEASAYRCVETVFEHGEFAVRGSIMDIFPMGSTHPFRLDLFDDEIESLRTFDPETQRSLEIIDKINLLPAKEFPMDRDSVRRFQDRWHERFSVDARACPIYQDVSSGIAPAGVEYYLPLFFDQTETLFDYLPADTLICTSDIQDTMSQQWREAESRYENLRYDVQRPLLAPDEILLRPDHLNAALNQFSRIDARNEPPDSRFPPLPDVSVKDRSNRPLSVLRSFAAESNARILVVTESAGRREVVDEMFRKNDFHLASVSGWQRFCASDDDFAITVADIDRGLWLKTPHRRDLVVITEQDLYGGQVLQRRRREQMRENTSDLVIKSLTELSIGAPVVHIDHGVGRYQGLVTLEVDGSLAEFLNLSYQEDAKLYVPVASLHLISRYSGAEESIAPLHRLGGETWQKAKRKAAEQIHDVAAELLNIYARREAKPGFSHPIAESVLADFTAEFPFEETPDQQQAIENVLTDMSLDRAMDRLVCGDVGFGKTEVAMRAAFVAVQAGKQVAILVPTTLLAQQHGETFKDRFANWPMTIDVMSRFRTRKEHVEIRGRLEAGTLDIVIGTHTLIQDAPKFKDLGLLVLDEEHRFGVRQKEALKSLRSEVDILTLTATPIPRTLNLAMSGMRDLSIIATPPAKRLSIKTFIRQNADGLVQEAVQRELQRGGQVYYLHNDVKTISNTARKLQELAPEARIGIGHGQMRERELEQVMSDFYHKRINVLVCTTIIETGIDIPNANTIVMDRADKFGLAQIHQLRGRVGRSHHQAYAYLLTPHPKAMTGDAVKRLEAIAGSEELGSGFILATHDLEIRGAGELLGDQQTGNIQTIGYTLYMEMLDRAVKAIKEGKTPNLDRPLTEGTEINLHVPALIPDDYLPDVHNRLVLYKRISNASDLDRLSDLQAEMIDRFGLLPEATRSLFRVTQIKLQAEGLGVKRIDIGERGGRIEFNQDTRVDPAKIVRLVQSEPHRYRLSAANQIAIDEKVVNPQTRFMKVEKLLSRLEPNARSANA